MLRDFFKLQHYLQDMVSYQGVALPRFALPARQQSNRKRESRWIGRGGLVALPPHSLDLTPFEFSLLVYFKDRVFSCLPITIYELNTNIWAAIASNS